MSPPEDDGGPEGGIDGGGDEEEEDDEPGGELVSMGFVGGYTPIAVPGDPGIGVLGEDSTGGCSVVGPAGSSKTASVHHPTVC